MVEDIALGELTYRQVLEANNAIQTIGDDTYWLCVTRTVQESKLFPVPAYMLLSYLNCFYRYPTLLRKIDAAMPSEQIGDRARGDRQYRFCRSLRRPATPLQRPA